MQNTESLWKATSYTTEIRKDEQQHAHGRTIPPFRKPTCQPAKRQQSFYHEGHRPLRSYTPQAPPVRGDVPHHVLRNPSECTKNRKKPALQTTSNKHAVGTRTCTRVRLSSNPFTQVVPIITLRQLRIEQLHPVPTRASSTMTPEENAQYLTQGVQSALHVQQRAFADNTIRQQQDAMSGFRQWLQTHGQGAAVTDCNPEHVMAYMELHWIPRRSTPNRAAAPSSITTTLSLPSTQFWLMGRGQTYELACEGNPPSR